jgi:broad specificity phosphatase PhoE
MSTLYLIRHGQAGTRQLYDTLSDLGRAQARHLGDYFAAQRIEFAAVYSGALHRQIETAAQVHHAYSRIGFPIPDAVVDSCWNEFDLDEVYERLAPLVSADDPEFQRDYDEMREAVRRSQLDPHAEVHRRWRRCDVTIVRAWIEGRYPFSGESWSQFRERVTSPLERLRAYGRDDVIAVFTSATPVALWMAAALGIDEHRTMQLAAAQHNSAFTVLQLRPDGLRLSGFNHTPHLAGPGLRTYR